MVFLEKIKNRNVGKVTEAMSQGQISFFFSQAVKQNEQTNKKIAVDFAENVAKKPHTGHSLSDGSVCNST